MGWRSSTSAPVPLQTKPRTPFCAQIRAPWRPVNTAVVGGGEVGFRPGPHTTTRIPTCSPEIRNASAHRLRVHTQLQRTENALFARAFHTLCDARASATTNLARIGRSAPPCPVPVPPWTRTASAARAGIGLRKHQAHSVIKEVCTGRCRPSQAEGYS